MPMHLDFDEYQALAAGARAAARWKALAKRLRGDVIGLRDQLDDSERHVFSLVINAQSLRRQREMALAEADRLRGQRDRLAWVMGQAKELLDLATPDKWRVAARELIAAELAELKLAEVEKEASNG